MKATRILASLAASAALLLVTVPPAAAQDTDTGANAGPSESTNSHANPDQDETFNEDEIVHSASDFFGFTTEATAKAVERVFSDLGQPDAYIKGDEGSGAFILGERYGSGWLVRKGYEPVKVYWKGPSIGFDVGGNASKCFTLIYNLKREDRIFQRFPGVEGSYYFIAGIGINYMRSGGVTLAPMRTGVGLRAGVNAHYQVYTHSRDWFPL